MHSGIMAQRQWHKLVLFSLLGVGVLLIGLISGAVMADKGWRPFKSGNQTPLYMATANSQATFNAGFSAVAKAVTPAVVTVEVSVLVRRPPFPFFGDPSMNQFGDFFRWRLPPELDD